MIKEVHIPSYDTARAASMLDWADIMEALCGYAHSDPGVLRCRRIEFLKSANEIRVALEEVSQAKGLLERSIPFSFAGLTDVSNLISRAKARGTLEAEELLRVADVLRLARRIKDGLDDNEETAPRLAEIASMLHNEPTLEKEITHCIDKDGKVQDHATPELRALRDRYHQVHSQVHDTLTRMIESKRYEELLMDDFFSLRNGRYVLPVRIEKKSEVDGIVHDISNTGQSLFIEPKEVTHLNNQLRTCELEIEREVYRILSMLSFKVADHAEPIQQSIIWLAELDYIFAKARYSLFIDGSAALINTQGIVNLRQARHPVLLQQGEQVVANDIALDEKSRVLIVTGPNTGGKTVALKTLGACALMTRAGMHIPTAPDSEMGLFLRIFAMVGDEQSIQTSQSSFSAHLIGLRYILDHLVPDSLVLIDEIGEGTDPNQGIALSKAVIERLQTGRVRSLITTHFAELTALGFADSGVANASMEFDSVKFEPTYRLVKDLPGRSSAFEIASRMGLDDELISRARQFATGTDSKLDQVMKGLEEQQEKYRLLAQEAQKELEQAKRDAAEQRRILEELKERKGKTVVDERKQIKKEFEAAKNRLNQILSDLQGQPTFKRVEGSRQKIKQVQKDVERRFPEEKPEPMPEDDARPIKDWSKISVGDRVWVRSFKNFGEVEMLPDNKGNVRLIVSGARLTLSSNQIFLKPEVGIKAAKKEGPEYSFNEDYSAMGVGVVNEELRCDLRGMTSDEALDRVHDFLDQALRRRFGVVTIVHGHGTGVLKRDVREYLKSSPYVKSFRPGKRGEGGDGASIVEIDL